jgi:hypothetical protein
MYSAHLAFTRGDAAMLAGAMAKSPAEVCTECEWPVLATSVAFLTLTWLMLNMRAGRKAAIALQTLSCCSRVLPLGL